MNAASNTKIPTMLDTMSTRESRLSVPVAFSERLATVFLLWVYPLLDPVTFW